MTAKARPFPGLRRAILWTEFVGLFVGAPVLMTLFFGQYPLFAAVWGLTALAAGLLTLTPGFSWRMALAGPVLREWPLILGYSVATAAACAALVFWLTPHSWLTMPTQRTGLWIAIMTLYPLLSALPQELIYRSLFFERYGALLPSDAARIAANGALFGLGHLFYMNPVAILTTALNGAVIGWAYLRGRSLMLAWLLHALAGQIMFTAGLGRFFYHGAVGG